MGAADFWNDPENAKSVTKQQKEIADLVDAVRKTDEQWEYILTAIALADEDEDAADELRSEAAEQAEAFESRLRALELGTMLTGEYDHGSAIVSIHAGMGGGLMPRTGRRYCSECTRDGGLRKGTA